MSQQYNTTYSDRGTGYNFFDGTSWGAQPTTRLESSRGGWPSIIALGNGGECAITHNTDNSLVNNTFRANIGSGSWTENTVTPDYLIWNRSASGGNDGNTIHMIGVTASTAFGGLPFNGLDGALVYYRSQDGGITWDITNLQLPGMDTSMYYGMQGDHYAISAKGETVVVAYFDDWGDSYIVKSIDNGDTWTKTIFLDFPVDKYATDDGIDLSADGVLDRVYSTDNYGTLILDDNGNAHVFYGVMLYADDDLADASFSWYPSTNGIAYWTESFGPDNTPPSVHPGDSSLWYSDMMNDHWITKAPDINGDGVVGGIDDLGGYALYYASRASMPSAGIDSSGALYLSFSGYTETADNGTQVFRHIYVTKSEDGGTTWSCPVDVTPHNDWNGMQECVFGSMSPVVDDKIRILYQKDFEPGLSVSGDVDMVDNNWITYLEVSVSVFDTSIIYGCSDSTATNYNPNATNDDGSCIPFVYGCTDYTAVNYNSFANTDDGSCIYCNQNTVDTLSYTGAMQTYTVPAGVTSVTIEAYGAEGRGASSSTYNSGKGGYSYGNLSVTAGQVLNIYVGGEGTLTPTGNSGQCYGGFNGGGNGGNGIEGGSGGGASDVRVNGTSFYDRVIVAGGGGGSNWIADGGDGGGLNGSDGNGEIINATGGTQYSGGTGASYNGFYGTDGVFGVGGESGVYNFSEWQWGGGAGGGFYGGGGGAPWNSGAGGSSYIGGVTNGTTTSGIQYGNGLVIISYSIQTCTGCTDPAASNYDSLALYDDGSCIICDLSTSLTIMNPTSPTSCDGFAFINATSSYSPINFTWFNINNNIIASGVNFVQNLCHGAYYIESYDSVGCLAVDTFIIGDLYGCTDPAAYNYDPLANIDDGSCISVVYGCADSSMFNYNSSANIDDGSCTPFIYGCTDPTALNYDASVNTDDGSCQYCDLSISLTVMQESSPSVCDGWVFINASSSNTPISLFMEYRKYS